MGWIIFVIQLISALPGLIRAVKEIIALIKALPKSEQPEARQKLIKLAKAAKSGTMKATPHGNEIDEYLAELRSRVGKTA